MTDRAGDWRGAWLVGTLLAAFVLSMPSLQKARAEDRSAVAPSLCATCFTLRVGLPHMVRGPAADIADNRFTEIELPGGGFRGFDAHGETRAIDGRTPSDMGAPGRIVLKPGPAGSSDSCGQWLNHAERVKGGLLGFVHAETACNYAVGQTHKSMALATSTDDGLTWRSLGPFITGTDGPTVGRNTGEGDCTAVDGHDAYDYAYCFRPRDSGLIVARAATADPAPGRWMKFFDGRWDQPGLGGEATRLMNGSGTSIARWTTTGDLVATGWVPGGLGLFLTRDHVTFEAVKVPLLELDPGVWQRPAPSELVTYPVLLDAKNGSNQLSNTWMLAYAYWPPGGGHADKYLVLRHVAVFISRGPDEPQVGVLLARWYDPALHDRWSTTGPVQGGPSGYVLDKRQGYLMTAAVSGNAPSLAIEDCVSDRAGHPDHLLAERGFCETHTYRRLRTAGWVYTGERPGTIPLYRCYNAKDQSHFASNRPDCEGLGEPEQRLGYVLAK